MPIYEFRCSACGKHFEKLCGLSDDHKAISCPNCGATSPQRLISTFSARGNDGNSASSGNKCSGCKASSCAGCH